MSGHSKWNNIKRKKEKTDGARAKVFTKIGREISVAVRDGGPNPASNRDVYKRQGVPCLHRLRMPAGLAVPERTAGARAPAV